MDDSDEDVTETKEIMIDVVAQPSLENVFVVVQSKLVLLKSL